MLDLFDTQREEPDTLGAGSGALIGEGLAPGYYPFGVKETICPQGKDILDGDVHAVDSSKLISDREDNESWPGDCSVTKSSEESNGNCPSMKGKYVHVLYILSI